MRHFQFVEQGQNDEPFVVNISDEEILATYFSYWQEEMLRAGKADQISPESCIEDFCAVHWASEVK